MENASKALIIAGAILISILLISVGILMFNSSSGVTDNAGETGDVMASAAIRENVKIILSTMDIQDDIAFNNYIKAKYQERILTAQETLELCLLVVERTKQIAGTPYKVDETHVTGEKVDGKGSPNPIYCDKKNNGELNFENLNRHKKYKVWFNTSDYYKGNYSIQPYEASN